MQTSPVTADQFATSVLAVPPLCRNADGSLNAAENQKQVSFLEDGGVSMLLYGGNANLYHIRPSEYESLLTMLAEISGDETLVIPAVGPAYGTMMDQAAMLKPTQFPTAMILPTTAVMTEPGLMSGFRQFVETIDRKAVLYIKDDNYITPEGAAELVDDGLVSFIKYAIVRDNPAEDEYLERLIDKVDPQLICSGIGEQPAMIHMSKFGCVGYTSGCVCVNATLSTKMLHAIGDKDWDLAESIRTTFVPLEDLRNEVNPIRVLHDAVELADIAVTGPHIPLLSGLTNSARDRISRAAIELKNASV